MADLRHFVHLPGSDCSVAIIEGAGDGAARGWNLRAELPGGTPCCLTSDGLFVRWHATEAEAITCAKRRLAQGLENPLDG